MAVRSKAWVCSRLIAGIVFSNPAQYIIFLSYMSVCCEGGGLCGGLITRPEGSYRVCVCVCVGGASNFCDL